MTEALASYETLELAFRRYQEESRRERIKRFRPDMLAWLALPPQWTSRLAQQAGFPGWDPAFLDAAANEGLCARSEASVGDQPPWYASEIGARLAAYLPAASNAELLDEVAAIDDQHARARILATLTGSLPSSLLPRAAQIADSLQDPAARTRALLGLAAVEPPAEAEVTTRRALSVAEQLEDPGDRAETLLLIVDQVRLDDRRRKEFGQAVLATLPEMAYESERSSVLARAAPYLTEQQVRQALEASLALRAADCRIEALAGVTERLSRAEGVRLLEYEIAAIPTIHTEIGRGRAARTLARRLADYGAADLATNAAMTLADEGARETALQDIAGSLASAGDQGQAAEATATVVAYGVDSPDAVISLSMLALRLADGDRSMGAGIAERAQLAAAALASSSANAAALVSLATALVRTGIGATDVAERALQAIAGISGADDRYQLYRRLLIVLPEPLRSRALGRALVAAQGITSLSDRIDALVDLAPHLPPQQLETLIGDARSLVYRETDFSFWMPEPARTEVLNELVLRHGAKFLQEQAGRIAEGVRGADRPNDLVSPAMARWAELASYGAIDPAQAATWLDQRLASLTEEGESGQALAWAETGKLLVPVLGQELDSVVSVGLRRVELLYRRSLDLGHLRWFLARQEQIDEFWRLLDGDSETWAVHYLGPGGLGKTMLLRQVTAKLAPERGIPTARVDFDHLSPDYPIAKPGQLLLELLDELQSFSVSSRADSFAYSFRVQVTQLHAPVIQDSNDPLARIHDKQFDLVLATFRDYVLLLPQPVVLILDTCEELAKRRSEGSTLPPVEATFEILERLHDEIPTLRVIFAGRRLLARSGSGWAVSPDDDVEGHALLPERKAFLRLHQMSGFSREEAVHYLDMTVPGLSAGMPEAILARSSAPGNTARIVWEPPRTPGTEDRYNPFDLNLYASWAREDPALRAETIAQGTTDPYIALRIIRRLGRADLERLLPAVILLGRFDRSMLRAELPGSDETFGDAYRDLSAQEWIDYQPNPSLHTTFLEVDRNLRPRLLAYYRGDPDRSFLLHEAQGRLGPALARLVEERPLHEIGVDLIDAAMRLLPPVDAARLWDKVADKIRAQGDWAWADQRTSRLLGEDGAVADPSHPARAAVVASRIGSLVHTRSDYDTAPDWREVAERADATPDPIIRGWLKSRAIAGKVTAFRLFGVELSADDLAAFWELVDQFAPVAELLPASLAEQLAASCCAALEALVEVAEYRGDASLVSDTQLVERWLGCIEGQAPADLLAWGTMIAARAEALNGRFAAALELAAQAERSSADLPASRPGRWADFDAPPMACHRIRLELIRLAALPVTADPLRGVPLDAWQRSAEAGLGTIDADRLLAAILLRRLSAGILPVDEVTRLAELEEQTAESGRLPRSSLLCHLRVPPLFTAVARCWLALGRSDRAIELLNARRRRALAVGDADAQNAALIGTLEISRRMRIAQPVLAKNSGKSPDAAQQAAAWTLAALTEQPGVRATEPVGEIPDERLHDWWRSRPALAGPKSEDAQLFRRRATGLASSRVGLPPFSAVSLGLDLAEQCIAEATSPTWLPVDLAGLGQSGRCTSEQLVRVTLRMLALGHPVFAAVHPPPGVDSSPAHWLHQADRWAGVGRRRKAELAMDEGELLALRLPREAASLLDVAASWFSDADDPASALFARIAGTLARQRSGMPVATGNSQSLAATYDAMASRAVVPLPTWADLIGEYLVPPSRHLEKQAESALGGWLGRLAACLDRGGAPPRGKTPGPTSPAQVKTKLKNVPGPGSVPAELDLSRPAQRRVRRRRTRPLFRLVRWLLRFFASFTLVYIAVTLIGSAVVAIVLVIITAVVHDTGNGVAAAIVVAIVAVILALAGVAAVLRWTIRGRRLAARARARRWSKKALVWLRIMPASSTGATGDIRVAIDKWQAVPRDRFPWTRRAPVHAADIAVLPPLRAYLQGAAAVPASFQADLRQLASRVAARSLRITLDIDPELERLPWEALLSYPILAAESDVPGSLDFWRRGEPSPETARPPRPRHPVGVCVLADGTRRLFAERAALGRDLSFLDLSASVGADVNRTVERSESLGHDPPDIVLVIGRPARAHGAVLLQVAEQADARGTSADELREAVVGGGLLEPEVVAGLRARLFIILGAPMESGSRFDTERRDAADLRGWAADVFRAGAATVISLPSLSPTLAEAVLREISSALRKEITPATVHAAVRAARVRIGTWAQSAVASVGGPSEGGAVPAERRVEQALDVCLFRRAPIPAAADREERTRT
jgi:hypothetical protein